MQKWIIFIIILIIVILGIFIVINVDIETEYTPETEIEDIELRKTIITLYFKDKETGELSKETRLIDSKDLVKNPYNVLINFLLEGPENANNERVIPEEAKILDISFDSSCVTINFSKDSNIDNLQEDKLEIMINSIFKTLTELTEVNCIKILVEGCELEEISNVINNLKI